MGVLEGLLPSFEEGIGKTIDMKMLGASIRGQGFCPAIWDRLGDR